MLPRKDRSVDADILRDLARYVTSDGRRGHDYREDFASELRRFTES